MKPLTLGIVVSAIMLLSCGLRADEKAETIAKQKAAAESLWKKMEFEKTPALVESSHFLLFSRLPEARTKTLSSQLERNYATAIRGLKFDKDEKPWSGKLAIFVLGDNSDFVNFMRRAQKRSPREGEVVFVSIAGDEPLMVIGEPESTITPENQAVYELSISLLKRKMGAGDPPDWVAAGFARATAYRTGNPNAKTRGFKTPIAPFSALWSDQASAELRYATGAYIVDYVAYGPGNSMLTNFLSAIRPGENGEAPGAEQILKTTGGDAALFELYARRWTKPAAPKTPPKKKK